jgi:methyl-accepting chemotaxis protein
VVILFAVVIGLLGILTIINAAAETDLLSNRTTMAILSMRLDENVQQQRAAYLGASTYSFIGDSDAVTARVTNMETLDQDYIALEEKLAGMLTTDEGRRLLTDIGAAYTTYRTGRDAFVAVVQNPDSTNEELTAAIDHIIGPVGEVADDVTLLVEFIDNLTTEQAAAAEATASRVIIILIVVLALAVAVSVFIALYIARLIIKPINIMNEILIQVGETGNLQFTEETRGNVLKEAEAKDEMGQSLKSFAQTIDRLRYIGGALETVAGRDLTIDVDLLGPDDTMGVALNEMVGNLNEMFGEINGVASQVASASNEIAQGAQSLAQGSTEQASTVQEISASINEINEQASASSKTAESAARYSAEISGVAQEGNDKMNHMMQSVQEINDASQSIGRVIKVIDDIAFQTNILALNAAVEAARAGEHGKGFAVVADEVRNLAGKSAEAAKETAALISANIEKAELGLSISRETAENLARIIEGIQSTSESLQDISAQNQQSKASTAQVTQAMDQVAQVVQQNSATSEESAAASEEMNSQALVLQQLIARFKLKR